MDPCIATGRNLALTSFVPQNHISHKPQTQQIEQKQNSRKQNAQKQGSEKQHCRNYEKQNQTSEWKTKLEFDAASHETKSDDENDYEHDGNCGHDDDFDHHHHNGTAHASISGTGM